MRHFTVVDFLLLEICIYGYYEEITTCSCMLYHETHAYIAGIYHMYVEIIISIQMQDNE